jgi:predicted Fe-S protein YdhL (DUF1289 family)
MRIKSSRAKAVDLAVGPVPSPCVSVCRINAHSGLCDGCWRTIDEIAHWSTLDDECKRAIWRQLPARRGGAV